MNPPAPQGPAWPEPIATDGEPAISARSFYLEVLEHDATQFNRWLKRNVIDSPDFTEGRDYEIFDRPVEQNGSGGHNRQDAALSLRCAQNLCLMSKTPRGREYREHLLTLEDQARLAQRQRDQDEARRDEIKRLMLLDVPRPWQRFFSEDWWIEHRRVFGCELFGTFWVESFYNRLPDGVELLRQIREANPRDDEGNRTRKHHQHLGHEAMVREQASVTLGILINTPTGRPDMFWTALDRKYPVNGNVVELMHIPRDGRHHSRQLPLFDLGECLS